MGKQLPLNLTRSLAYFREIYTLRSVGILHRLLGHICHGLLARNDRSKGLAGGQLRLLSAGRSESRKIYPGTILENLPDS
jgi:hypothetical protein